MIKTVERVKEYIQYWDMRYMEYRENECGDDYSHLLSEGGWVYYNADQKILNYLNDVMEVPYHVLSGVSYQIETMSFIDSVEIVGGSIYGRYNTDKPGLIIDAYPLDEVENCYSIDSLCEELGTEWGVRHALNYLEKKDRDLCLRTYYDQVLTYNTTDHVYYAFLPESSIIEVIANEL
jgi:hypothetical protein